MSIDAERRANITQVTEWMNHEWIPPIFCHGKEIRTQGRILPLPLDKIYSFIIIQSRNLGHILLSPGFQKSLLVANLICCGIPRCAISISSLTASGLWSSRMQTQNCVNQASSGRPRQIFCRNTESRNCLFSKAEPKPKPNIRPKHIIRPKQISSAKIDCFGQKFLFSHAILDYHKWPKHLL